MTHARRSLVPAVLAPALVLGVTAGAAAGMLGGGGALGSPTRASRSRADGKQQQPLDQGCFGATGHNGKAQTAKVLGAAVGGAVGAPLLARVLPTPGAGASVATQMAEAMLWNTAFGAYWNLIGTLAQSSPAPLFVQYAPGQFATASSLFSSANNSPLGPFAPPMLAESASPVTTTLDTPSPLATTAR